MTNYLVFGLNSNGQLGRSEGSELRELKKPNLKEFQSKTIKMVATNDSSTLWLTTTGEVILINYLNSTTTFELEKIVHIGSNGRDHYIAVAETGNVYVWGKNNSYGQLGTGSSSTVNTKPTKLDYFEGKKAIEGHCGECHSLVLCSTGDVHGFGINNDADCGNGTTSHIYSPEHIHSNIKKLWVGYAGHNFMRTNEGKIMGFGQNSNGELGIGNSTTARSPVEITFFNDKTVQDFAIGYSRTLALTSDGKVYASGKGSYFGSSSDTNTFLELTSLDGKKGKAICASSRSSIVLTTDGTFHCYGQFYNSSYYGSSTVEKPSFKLKQNCVSMVCSPQFGIYIRVANDITCDLEKLFKRGELTNFEIQGIKAHKSIIQSRVEKDLDLALQVLRGFKPKEVELFVKWIYTDSFNDPIIKNICTALGIKDFETKTLGNDLKRLFLDDKSKDFTILVPFSEEQSDSEEDEEESEGENEEELDEIPCHKIILQARSGLFREMFLQIEDSKEVKDMSGKSLEALEIFIQYLYTDNIEFTADHDVPAMVEELKDCAEYYQLDENSNFNYKLSEHIQDEEEYF
ncbi:btk-binding protein-related [Anaeramoeba flamelloides]|uniref:Btk-binding protein-related n=1 Tax=Anaeramoeba flamelloides TaxID=1746091 RepID=A0AAV7ZZ50_9EUKA|nr:btk-binding protein-related [Anaeramoeba flamelloides]|eukprot:Anaeramoba_flamelloidesa570405_464.p1 GENE.a570405_464~~a570405_464.p1  ORF type:complete len:573 (-),score=139.38 a570405_464:191-1909(-)